MTRRHIESLESRRLYSASAFQDLQVLDSPGVADEHMAITPVGLNNFLIAYNSNTTLDGIIVDARGAVVVPKFTIVKLAENSFIINVTAATTPQGNTIIAYDLYPLSSSVCGSAPPHSPSSPRKKSTSVTNIWRPPSDSRIN